VVRFTSVNRRSRRAIVHFALRLINITGGEGGSFTWICLDLLGFTRIWLDWTGALHRMGAFYFSGCVFLNAILNFALCIRPSPRACLGSKSKIKSKIKLCILPSPRGCLGGLDPSHRHTCWRSSTCKNWTRHKAVTNPAPDPSQIPFH